MLFATQISELNTCLCGTSPLDSTNNPVIGTLEYNCHGMSLSLPSVDTVPHFFRTGTHRVPRYASTSEPPMNLGPLNRFARARIMGKWPDNWLVPYYTILKR